MKTEQEAGVEPPSSLIQNVSSFLPSAGYSWLGAAEGPQATAQDDTARPIADSNGSLTATNSQNSGRQHAVNGPPQFAAGSLMMVPSIVMPHGVLLSTVSVDGTLPEQTTQTLMLIPSAVMHPVQTTALPAHLPAPIPLHASTVNLPPSPFEFPSGGAATQPAPGPSAAPTTFTFEIPATRSSQLQSGKGRGRLGSAGGSGQSNSAAKVTEGGNDSPRSTQVNRTGEGESEGGLAGQRSSGGPRTGTSVSAVVAQLLQDRADTDTPPNALNQNRAAAHDGAASTQGSPRHAVHDARGRLSPFNPVSQLLAAAAAAAEQHDPQQQRQQQQADALAQMLGIAPLTVTPLPLSVLPQRSPSPAPQGPVPGRLSAPQVDLSAGRSAPSGGAALQPSAVPGVAAGTAAKTQPWYSQHTVVPEFHDFEEYEQKYGASGRCQRGECAMLFKKPCKEHRCACCKVGRQVQQFSRQGWCGPCGRREVVSGLSFVRCGRCKAEMLEATYQAHLKQNVAVSDARGNKITGRCRDAPKEVVETDQGRRCGKCTNMRPLTFYSSSDTNCSCNIHNSRPPQQTDRSSAATPPPKGGSRVDAAPPQDRAPSRRTSVTNLSESSPHATVLPDGLGVLSGHSAETLHELCCKMALAMDRSNQEVHGALSAMRAPLTSIGPAGQQPPETALPALATLSHKVFQSAKALEDLSKELQKSSGLLLDLARQPHHPCWQAGGASANGAPTMHRTSQPQLALQQWAPLPMGAPRGVGGLSGWPLGGQPVSTATHVSPFMVLGPRPNSPTHAGTPPGSAPASPQRQHQDTAVNMTSRTSFGFPTALPPASGPQLPVRLPEAPPLATAGTSMDLPSLPSGLQASWPLSQPSIDAALLRGVGSLGAGLGIIPLQATGMPQGQGIKRSAEQMAYQEPPAKVQQVEQGANGQSVHSALGPAGDGSAHGSQQGDAGGEGSSGQQWMLSNGGDGSSGRLSLAAGSSGQGPASTGARTPGLPEGGLSGTLQGAGMSDFLLTVPSEMLS